MGRRRCRELRSERGAAAVEFAFIAPVLVLLLFAIIGYGYMLSFRQAMSQGASEGARAAAVAPGGLATTAPATVDSKTKRVLDAVNQGLRSYGVTCTAAGKLTRGTSGTTVDAGTCAITIGKACSASTTAATCAEVKLDYFYQDFPLIPTVPGLGFTQPGHLTYTSEVEMS